MSKSNSNNNNNDDGIMGLYKFELDCGRQGYLEGIFTASRKDVSTATGKEWCTCDVLGKHSETWGTLEEGEIELITEDPWIVSEIPDIGFNPLCYIEED